MNFNKFKTFIFDLDGTIWNWESLYPGVKEKIERLQKLGKQILFTTNNTLLSSAELLKKLNSFGIDVKADSLLTAGFAVGKYLAGKKGNVLAIGEGIKADLKSEGIPLTESSDCRYVVIGYDRAFNLEKLAMIDEALKSGATLLATTRGKRLICGKRMLPGTGIVVGLVESFCKKRAKILGKPSDFFAKLLWTRVTSLWKDTVLVGDSCGEDILLGRKLGFYTVLVLTGVDKKVGKVKPDLVINSAAGMKI